MSSSATIVPQRQDNPNLIGIERKRLDAQQRARASSQHLETDMGLDTSHDCWHGAYSAFMTWRTELARAAGLPPLELMDGFYKPLDSQDLPTLYYGMRTHEHDYLKRIDGRLPISWACLKPSALHLLLHHSDCDGEISWHNCDPIADELEKLLTKLPSGDAGGHIGNWRDKTSQFIKGLRSAAKKKENVDFH